MGRRKTYERDDLIAKAMECFRDRGFGGTSTAVLVEELGVNRNSLYSEFGSKQALFDACLERYDAGAISRNFGPLEAPDAGLKQVRQVVEFFASAAAAPAMGRGCLLCNTAVEFGPEDPSGHDFVANYLARLSGSFLNALSNAKRDGTLRATASVDDEAQFLTATVLGIFVMLRAAADPAMIRGATNVAIRHIRAISKAD
ncbi:MAG: TetR/AcrR family transcriptional repressor of nem operon [Bradymonadia bacterium]|jgi:TetR/AcrR family transcriptional repressor of nem operon